jgi:DNA polymerase-1
MTSDKDMKALLTDNIECIDPLKSIKHTKNTFMQERCFEPIHMIDYLSIIGDASDNIPGVKGV